MAFTRADSLHVTNLLFFYLGPYQDVVNVNNNTVIEQVPKHLIDKRLESVA